MAVADPVEPRVLSLAGRPETDSGAHPGQHVTVPKGKGVVLRYRTEGAEQVQASWAVKGTFQDEGEAHPGGEGEILVHPREDCEYTLKCTASGREVRGGLVYVDVHDPGELVAPVALTHAPKVSLPLDLCSLLLCGPMLRRVESAVPGDAGKPGHVCVFVATQRPCKVQLKLYATGPLQANQLPPQALKQGEALTLPLGPRLHVALVDLQGAVLEAGQLYSYDLALQPVRRDDPKQPDGQSQTLDSLHLLAGPGALGYHDGTLPSFLAPPATLSELRLLHGSCRKVHGQGEDALVLADKLIAEKFTGKLGPRLGGPQRLRPHQLLLTGDQIYSDDVPVAFCELAGKLAEQLLCPWWKDGTQASPDLRFLEASARRYPPGGVRATMHSQAIPGVHGGLPGHLVFLGEFLATYLLAFSPELWPKNSQGHPALKLAAAQEQAEPTDQHRYRKLAEDFGARLGSARRVFANVPTLMICDDHEVTNNWNLDRAWVDNLRSSPRARRIARNALCAYAVFQDWGNRPDLYAEGGAARPVLEALQLRRFDDGTDRPPAIIEEPKLLDGLLLPPGGPLDATAGTLHFDYTLEFQSHRLVMLDTRTHREFPSSPQGGARLIDQGSLDQQLPKPAGAPDALPADKLTVVVSAVPVLSGRLAEGGLAVFARIKGPDDTDHESWPIHREGFGALLHRLADHRRVLVLSGDVHYAFSAELSIARGANTSRIVQFCSSAIKNQNGLGAMVRFGAPAPAPPAALQRLWTLGGFVHASPEGGGPAAQGELASASDAIDKSLAAALELAGQDGAALRALAASIRAKTFGELGLLPLWAPGVKLLLTDPRFAEARRALTALFGEVRLRLDFLSDAQEGEEQISLSGPWAIDRAAGAAELWLNRTGTRTVIDFNNIALVTFRAEGGVPTAALQTLLWKVQQKTSRDPLFNEIQDTLLEFQALGGVGHTLHVARLTVPTAAELE